MSAIFLLLIMGLSSGVVHDTEAAQAAVAAHPDRPGLRLVLADHLLAAGDLDAAEAQALGVLARWPTSSRARLLLARVAHARGDTPQAARWLAEIERTGAAMVRADARRWRQPAAAGRWLAWGRLAGQYDTRALSVGSIDVLPPVLGDTPALRAQLGAGAGYQAHTLSLRLGVERTVHLPAGTTDSGDLDVGTLDRTSLWAEARRGVALGAHLLDFGLLGRGTLAGRAADFSYAGGGLGLGWRRVGAQAQPWVRLRALGLALADADPLAWLEGEGGCDFDLGPLELEASVGAAWLGPDVASGREAQAGLRLGRASGRVRPFVGGGVGVRDDHRGPRPQASGGLRLFAARHAALLAEAGWQRIEAQDRLLAGLALEVWR